MKCKDPICKKNGPCMDAYTKKCISFVKEPETEFEEKFPSLKDRRILRLDGIVKYDVIPTKDIQENCLDKSVVKQWLMENFDNALLFRFEEELGL